MPISDTPSSAEPRASLVRAEDVAGLWPRVWPMLERALRFHGNVSEEGVRHRLCSELWQLWVCELDGTVEAALVTGIHDGPAFREVVVHLCGGSFGEGEARYDRARSCLARIESWARDVGASRIEFEGRPAWGRLFPGYQVRALVYTKELS